MKKNILFTFDYELFLGEKSGSVQKCMTDPTEKIISLLNRFHVKGIFFVDTSYLIRLREIENESAKNDVHKIFRQLQQFVMDDHYIFPHIHPHWLDAVYDEKLNQWNLSNLSKYRFHAIQNSEREFLFSESMKILKEIISPVKPDYKINSYRAGGWAIQPFDDFKRFFEKFGIENDFSVLPGFVKETTAQFFDFRKAPKKYIYRFENDVVRENLNGKYSEFSISSIDFSDLKTIFNRIFLKLNSRSASHKIFGDGTSIQPEMSGKYSSFTHNRNFGKEMVAIENMNTVKLPLYISFVRKNAYMQFISHPKMLTPHNLSTFEKFLRKVFTEYDTETDFRKMNPVRYDFSYL